MRIVGMVGRAVLLAVALVLVGTRALAEPLPVVASFTILADLVRAVGGPDVAVTSLVPPDGDSHVYEPSPADLRRLAGARVFFINGLGLEGWVPRLAAAAQFKGPVVEAAARVTPLPGDAGEHGPDPHAWQDVGNARLYLATIRDALVAADPAHTAAYDERAAAASARFALLDQWVRDQIATVPPAQRRIITTHDAFRYFGRAYGVRFAAPVGMSEDAEPTAGSLALLIRQIRAEGTHALFIENLTDPRLINQIAREAGTSPAGRLYGDALSPADGEAPDYDAMMRLNVGRMVAAMKTNR